MNSTLVALQVVLYGSALRESSLVRGTKRVNTDVAIGDILATYPIFKF